MMHAARSGDGRTEWYVDKGRLSEVSPSSPKFTLSAIDTHRLLELLTQCSAEIEEAYLAELTMLGLNPDKDVI
jgi:hypothetical protein